jgi:hypothetical protein
MTTTVILTVNIFQNSATLISTVYVHIAGILTAIFATNLAKVNG